MIYYIKFFDYCHIGSGDSAGVLYDNTVLKDENGFPYLPGKTIKGLVKEMMESIDKDYQLNEYFSNFELPLNTKKEIDEKDFLFQKVSSTAIDKKTKLAKDGSLRDIEVTIPLTLYGTIENIQNKTSLEKALKLIKRVGLNRNRGLGRCEIGEYKNV
jgi:CRISPR/Cas system CSM-associated protein Csm3 (group 7 of RAMP superfamily)